MKKIIRRKSGKLSEFHICNLKQIHLTLKSSRARQMIDVFLVIIHLLYERDDRPSTLIEPLTIFPPTPVEQLTCPNSVLTPKNPKIIASLKSISS